MAAHLSASRNERGRQVSSSQVIKFDEQPKVTETPKQPEQKVEKPVEKKVEAVVAQKAPTSLCKVERNCLTLGYDFNLYVEFNNLDLSEVLTHNVDVNSLDKIELYSEKSESSIFLVKSFITHYKLNGIMYRGIVFTGFELQSKCYPKMILLVPEYGRQKLIYSQRRM